jgi:phospholipid transport system transporter-binding protein
VFSPPRSLTFDNAAAVLEAGLHAIAGGQREIDLAGLEAVDSAAVAVLLAWQRAGRPLVFSSLPPNLQSLIDLYGVNSLLSLAPATDTAAY